MNATDKLDSKSWRFAKFAAFICFAVAGAILIASLAKAGSTTNRLDTTTQPISFSLPALSHRG